MDLNQPLCAAMSPDGGGMIAREAVAADRRDRADGGERAEGEDRKREAGGGELGDGAGMK